MLCLVAFHFFFGAGADCFSRFQTESVLWSPGLVLKSVGRWASGAPKQDFTLEVSALVGAEDRVLARIRNGA